MMASRALQLLEHDGATGETDAGRRSTMFSCDLLINCNQVAQRRPPSQHMHENAFTVSTTPSRRTLVRAL